MKQTEENVVLIPLKDLQNFPDHPFRIVDDEAMVQLGYSIKTLGVLNPVIVRELEDGNWQLISGHRRRHACELLGMEEIPAVVKKMNDDEATIMMVDSNFQREALLPSEKARAYKMKLDAVKRQGSRSDLTSAHDGQKLNRKSSRDLIAENSPDSSTQIQRFVRLNELIPELMEFVDAGRVAVTPAVELSYLGEEEQMMIVAAVESEQSSPSLSQAQRIRRIAKDGNLTEDMVVAIMSEKKKADSWNLTLPMNRVSRYFPTTYTQKQMQDTIITLLEEWLTMKKNQEEQENRGGKRNV